jgi:hypothetical protein
MRSPKSGHVPKKEISDQAAPGGSKRKSILMTRENRLSEMFENGAPGVFDLPLSPGTNADA